MQKDRRIFGRIYGLNKDMSKGKKLMMNIK